MIDSHCHLTHWAGEELERVISRAKLVGVNRFVVPSSNLVDSKRVIQLTKEYSEVLGAVGIHPEGVSKISNIEREIKQLEMLAKEAVAIGEIGLDMYWNGRDLEQQIEVFERQLELAVDLGKPVIIHNRLAFEEIGAVFGNIQKLPRGVMHCFSGDEKWLEYVIEKGFYVSFAGNVTYKSAGELRNRLKRVPLDRLLMETDSPYLPPEPLRGSVNEPRNVKIVSNYVSHELCLTPAELEQATTNNAICLFSQK